MSAKKNLMNIKSIISYYIVLLNLLSSPSIEKKERDRGKEERKGGREGGKKKGKEGERKEGKNEKKKEGQKEKKKKEEKREAGKEGRKLRKGTTLFRKWTVNVFFFLFPKTSF